MWSELPYLQARLGERADYFDQHDLRKCIVNVVEYDGQIVGFAAARLQWQVEPIDLFPEFQKHAPRFAQQRATLLLIRGIENWIGDRTRNTTGIYSYFGFILGRRMQQLAIAYGLMRVYWQRGGKFFGRDL